jgi:hypothetical protein
MSELTRQVWSRPDREADPDLHALGYLSRPLILEACDAAFEEVILPGLERNGVRP